jgi:glycosyltransferase involved in cell wall biosynthesis
VVVLIVHNFYRSPGGEDVVMHQESALLREAGHEVVHYLRYNADIDRMTLSQKAVFPKSVIWSVKSVRNLRTIIERRRPDVVHVHNTFPLVSPSIYHYFQRINLPVVQTLHNYRLLCAKAMFYREGSVCEKCLGRLIPYPGILHKCYHESFLESTNVAAMMTAHRLLGTWENKVDIYIALTNFSREKFIEAGIPKDKIVVKSNFVQVDHGYPSDLGEFALYVGRISEEKGTRTLLSAWKEIVDIPLKIVGDGPLTREVKLFVEDNKSCKVEYLGPRDREEVFSLMKQARFLLFPSEWYETFGMVVIEAFSCGLPVIASRLGAMQEIVQDGTTGLLFTPGDSHDLAITIKSLWYGHDVLLKMRKNARKEYESKYTAQRNYVMLKDIYQQAISAKEIELK